MSDKPEDDFDDDFDFMDDDEAIEPDEFSEDSTSAGSATGTRSGGGKFQLSQPMKLAGATLLVAGLGFGGYQLFGGTSGAPKVATKPPAKLPIAAQSDRELVALFKGESPHKEASQPTIDKGTMAEHSHATMADETPSMGPMQASQDAPRVTHADMPTLPMQATPDARTPPMPPKAPAAEPDFKDIANALSHTPRPDPLVQSIETSTMAPSPTMAGSNAQANQDGVPPASQPLAEVTSSLDNLARNMTRQTDNVKQLQHAIQDLANTLNRVNRVLNNMDARVLGLSETVDSLSDEFTHVKQIAAQDELPMLMHGGSMDMDPSSMKYHGKSDYSVHAIIPGRAWLKTTNGQIMTVTEGDAVGDLGKIAVIDAANSMVKTSSGVTIR